jgi:2-keto-4-pentenoate hydratase/2-oxohepta-3-ene-1,7-dioic acid hydratase in catechol pathway
MQLINFRRNGQVALGCRIGEAIADLTEAGGPSSVDEALAAGPEAMSALVALSIRAKTRIAFAAIEEWLPPVLVPEKALAIGLNYADHAAEGAQAVPEYPVVFSRYRSSWVGHKAPIIKPQASVAFDYEGEMVIVIGKPGRNIAIADALGHVAGYSLFNEGSARDFQTRTHQWTIGKNFDGSGSFGPFLVTADELPAGAKGLQLRTVLNGQEMQNASTSDMLFDVPTLIATLSVVMELHPGDIIISGTPSGVGAARTPPVFMQPGDVCEVSIEGIGTLSNPIAAETGSVSV